MENNNLYEKFEFLTGIRYGDRDYVGIVINHDNTLITFYDVDSIPSPELKKEFIELGDVWWWESNRMMPIDVFLNKEMEKFSACIKSFSMKNAEILFGPTTSLQNFLTKRIKRRSIQLVRKV